MLTCLFMSRGKVLRTNVVVVSALLLSLGLSFVGGMDVLRYSENNGVWNTPWDTVEADPHPTPKSDSPPAASLRVGSILPLTGTLGWLGRQMRDAADLAAEEINAAGGVLGKDIELIHCDSQTRPAQGANCAAKLVFVDNVVAIIGAASSGVSQAVSTITLEQEVVQISPASTSPLFSTLEPEEPGWFWRTAPSDKLESQVAGILAAEEGWETFGVLAANNPYGKGISRLFTDVMVAAGKTVKVWVNYTEEQPAYTSDLQLIASAAPDAVFAIAYPGDGLTMMQNWEANKLQPGWGWDWFWSGNLKSNVFLEQLKDANVDVSGIKGTAPILDSPNYETFRTAYLDRYGREPDFFGAHTYDALYLTALAAVASQGVNSRCIRNSLIAVANPPGTVVGPGPEEFERAVGILEAGGDINYEGASGRVNFNLVGDVGSSFEIWKIAGDLTTGFEFVQVDVVILPGIIDITPPTASFTVSPSAGEVTMIFTVDASSSSDAEDLVTALEVRWDWEDDEVWDTAWSTEKTAQHQYTEPGSYTISLEVRDTDGLADCMTKRLEVASPPDTTNPTIAIASPPDGATLTLMSVTVTGNASDDVALEKVELSTDETNWNLATGTTSWSASLTLDEGANTIFARATDTSGNTATISITVTVDTTPPGFQVSPTIVISAGVAGAAAAVAAFLLWKRRRG